MSGTQTSAFPDQNTLLSSLSGGLTASVQRNQLLNEQGRQQIGAADLDYASRLAQGVLGITDPSQRAAAYADGIQRLQAAGFNKNAPLQYPGDAAMQHVASLAIPVAQQYELGLVNPAGLSDAIDRITRGGSAVGPGASAAPSSGLPKEAFLDNVQQRESGGRNIPTQIKGPDGSPASTATGLFQIINSTWNEGKRLAGIDPNQYPQAMNAPADVQRKVASVLYDKYGEAPWAASAPTAPQGGVAGRYPGAVNTAGPGAGLPTAATDPGTADLDGPRPLPPVGPGSPTPPTPQVLANTPAPVQTAQAATPPPAAPQATPAMPPTGVNSPQFQRAMELQREIAQIASYPGAAHSPIAQAQIARLKAEAAANMQADSVTQVPGVGQVHSLSGAVDKPVAHYEWDADKGAYIDTTGGSPPVTPPSPRLMNQPGVGVLQSKPGGGATVVSPQNPVGLTEADLAASLGKATGADLVKQTNAYADRLQSSAAAVNQIDMGVDHLNKAIAGGGAVGKFAGIKNAINAGVMGLGLDPSNIPFIGQNPDAVGAVQVAKKSLAIVAGSIIRQAIGPGSEMTDAKLQGFIDAKPGIENAPDAIKIILNWARPQFVYENEMSKAALNAAANTPTGNVPPNFRSRYLADHGGGPIYNPSIGRTEQPDGQSPSRESPVPNNEPSSAAQKPQYVEGQTATGPGGKKAVYRNGGWIIQ